LANKKEKIPVDSMKSIQDVLIPGNRKVSEGDYKPNFLKDTASSSIPVLLTEIIKSLKGVNNSDIMGAIIKNQAELVELNRELKELKEKLSAQKSKPPGGGLTLMN